MPRQAVPNSVPTNSGRAGLKTLETAQAISSVAGVLQAHQVKTPEANEVLTLMMPKPCSIRKLNQK